MSRVMVREARSTTGVASAPRSTREFRDVRDPRQPDLLVELVRVCPSGVHVITAVTSPANPSPEDSVVVRAQQAADTVAALLPERYRSRVRPLLCRTDDAEVADLVGDLLVTSQVPLEHILRSSPVVLSTSEVNEVGRRLGAGLEPFPVEEAPGLPTRRWWCALTAAVLGALTAAAAAAQDSLPLLPLW